MIGRYRAGRIPGPAAVPPGGEDLDAAIRQAGDRVGAALARFDFRQATAAVWGIADEANRFVNRVRPWDLAKAEPAGRLNAVLYLLARACAAVGRELAPFLPDAAARVTAQCTPGEDGRLPDPRPVFRRLAPGAGQYRRRPGSRWKNRSSNTMMKVTMLGSFPAPGFMCPDFMCAEPDREKTSRPARAQAGCGSAA